MAVSRADGWASISLTYFVKESCKQMTVVLNVLFCNTLIQQEKKVAVC